jgi:amylosucrase
VLPASDPGILPLLRVHPEGELLELFNVTEGRRAWPMQRVNDAGLTHPYDALAERPVIGDQNGNVWLEPYQAMWIVNAPSGDQAGL